MKKFVYTIIGMIIAAIVIITFIGCDGVEVVDPVETLDVTEIETTESYVVITETSVITTTTTETTTTDTTSSTTDITSSTSESTITVDESVIVIEYEAVDSVNETVKEVESVTDTAIETITETVHTSSDVTEVEETDAEVETEATTNLTLVSTITELTYYSGPTGCKGRYNRTLANDYSIACNSLPDGTIVHIESDNGEINGDYRVDDTGGMGNKVIDIFYCSYNNVPKNFKRDGRISCTVWIVEE